MIENETKERQRDETELLVIHSWPGGRQLSVLSTTHVGNSSTGRVGALGSPTVVFPFLSALILDSRAATSRLAMCLPDGALTVGVVLSNDPNAHVDCFVGLGRTEKGTDDRGTDLC